MAFYDPRVLMSSLAGHSSTTGAEICLSEHTSGKVDRVLWNQSLIG